MIDAQGRHRLEYAEPCVSHGQLFRAMLQPLGIR